MAKQQESQIYHWGIKKGAPLDGDGDGVSRKSIGASSDAPGSVSLDGGGRGYQPDRSDASSDTTSTTRIHQLLQKVKAEAEGKHGAPGWVPQKIRDAMKEWTELNMAAAKRKALGDYLGYSPEFQKTLAPLLDKTLAAMEDIVLWEGLDRSSQVWQDLQPLYQERKETIQWLENILQKMEAPNGDLGLHEGGDGGTIINMIKNYKKEGQNDGESRQEDREKEVGRPAVSRGRSGANGSFAEVSIERGPYTYTYRKVEGIQREPIQRLTERFRAWGIEIAVVDGYVSITKDSITELRAIAEAAAVNGDLVFINQHMTVEPENVLGHEAYHIWKGMPPRNAYTDIIRDSIDFGSKAFQDYQKKIADAYLEADIDLTDLVQVRKFEEELFAYISGQINDGGYEDILRPMFRDFEAVKNAWTRLLEEMLGR